MRTCAIFLLGFLPASLFAQQSNQAAAATAHGSIATTQQRVDPTMTYHRVIAIVPLVGSGTPSDPKRPMFAPTPQDAASAAASHAGIIAYQHQLSDDGKSSIVELVAVDRSAFAALFASTEPGVQYFEIGKSTAAQIEAAIQQKKANFSLSNFFPLSVQ
jgi:hypothetical protein